MSELDYTPELKAELVVTRWLDDSKFLAINIELAHIIGLKEAVILNKLIYLYNYYRKNNSLSEGGAFFCTAPDLYEQTTILERTQRSILKGLEKIGLLKVTMKGLPAKRFIKLDFIEIEKIMNAPTKGGKNCRPDNSAENEPENPEKARYNQGGKNCRPRAEEIADQGRQKLPTNKKNLIKDFKEEEEEESAAAQIENNPVFKFLNEAGFEKDEIHIFLEKTKSLEYNHEQFLKAVTLSAADFNKGDGIKNRAMWLVGKIERVIKADQFNRAASVSAAAQKPKQRKFKPASDIKLPEWVEEEQKSMNDITPDLSAQEELERMIASLRA